MITKKKTVATVFVSIVVMLTLIITAAGSSRSIFASSTSNGIIIHYKDEYENPKIYYWNSLPKNLEVDWPGKKMKSEDNGWFTYSFDDVTKINFLFNDGNGNQTEDFSKDKAGEYWYKDGKWYTENPEEEKPDDPEDPSKPDYEYKEGKALGGDFRDDTIYFVITTRFFDGYKENNIHADDDEYAGNTDDDPAWRGDFKGLIEKLDYLKALGFSAIWVTPVVENGSSYDYHGYHAINFRRVDPRYESEGATYADLIDACHKKGIKVIQDIVLNHTGNKGEENLYPLIKKEYVLDKGVTGNSQKYIVNDPNHLLPDNYDSLNEWERDGNVPSKKNSRFTAMMNPDTIYRKNVDIGWESANVTTGQFADDCVELNTENPTVYNYLTETYNNYIGMGVDAFRIDTTKHISRLTFNKVFIPEFKKAAAANGNDDFYMFGEVASRVNDIWNHNRAPVSPPYYTWNEPKEYPWNYDSTDGKDNVATTLQEWNDNAEPSNQPTSDNGFLDGNDYHTPDYSKSSGLNVIDYAMHFNFINANKAFETAKQEDQYMNDPTWNVTYVDSHDYGPADNGKDNNNPDQYRYDGSEEDWAENWDLMFTFRGIPCVYYGSEIRFQHGKKIDFGSSNKLSESGRAYYGDNIEGDVTTTDVGEYTASGAVATTLEQPLSKHLMSLNKIRRAIPALRRGQYSVENCNSNGGIAFKRRYTDNSTDSFALVAISGSATFTGIPNGTYTDAITGNKAVVSDGTLTTDAISKPNMRIYVLDTSKTKAPGKLSGYSPYLK